MDTAKTYHFPYLTNYKIYPIGDCEEYPKLNRAISKDAYEYHKSMLEKMSIALYENQHKGCGKYIRDSVCDYERIYPEKQNTPYNWLIPFPAEGCPDRTVGSSGNFLLITKMVLKYFGINDVSIEDLVRIALWGDWHHKNGVWHHFVDVVCEAYGVETKRLSTLEQVMNCMNKGGICAALLSNEMFPGAVGNVLVLITEVSPKNKAVKFYYCGGHPEAENYRQKSILGFMSNAKVFWGFNA